MSALPALGRKSYEFTAELPPHWLGNLSGHLAGQNVDIGSVDAALLTAGMWKVSASILTGEGAPSQRELTEMARLTFASPDETRTRLFQYWIVREESCLYLSLRAVDRTGFLARLCADLAAHALFPVHVEAKCGDGVVVDSFRLRGIGHSVPHQETYASLMRFMESWRAGRLGRSSSIRPATR
jgi:hypothetical protein